MNFFTTHISPEAIKLVTETLESTFVSEGKRVVEFERALEDKLNLPNPVAVNSGTAALHLALVCAGIGRGDEVILPAQTFIATAMAVLYVGAKPVFADIDPRTGNLGPERLADKITARTRAIIPVHWGGLPCSMDEIHEIAGYAYPRIVVIEDAAHALGASYQGRPIGAVSEITCFSFQAIKPLTTGDGGLLCTTSLNIAESARRLRWFGIDREKDKANELGERQYNLTQMGFKTHMNDIAASIGLGNLPYFYERMAIRHKYARMYREQLKDVDGLTLLDEFPDRTSSYWLFTMLAQRRGGLMAKLMAHGIPSSVVHQRIDRHPLFGGINKDLVGQEYFDAHQLSLPLHADLTESDIERVCMIIREGW